jgi:hypothetical protein
LNGAAAARRTLPCVFAQARVLYVNPATKEVGLSLLPHLLHLTMPAAVPMMGQVSRHIIARIHAAH